MPPLPRSSARKAVYSGPALPGPQARPASRARVRARAHTGPPGERRPVPGWPLPRNDSTDAARGLWRKIVLLSSELRGFAPSREPVIVGRPGLPPTSTIACQASQPARTTARPRLGPQAAEREQGRRQDGQIALFLNYAT